MTYGVIGTGAIGGYYGARLAQSGQEVHFLLHRDYEYVCQNGLRVLSPQGDFHLKHPNVYNTTSQMPKCDVVLVCLKTNNNHLLRELLPPLLHERTLVLLIQNGIGVEADVQEMFPAHGSPPDWPSSARPRASRDWSTTSSTVHSTSATIRAPSLQSSKLCSTNSTGPTSRPRNWNTKRPAGVRPSGTCPTTA